MSGPNADLPVSAGAMEGPVAFGATQIARLDSACRQTEPLA